jgi:DNA-binding HxlR family transcriptional regulator
MSAEEACRLAAELQEEFGDVASRVAERTIVSLEEDGLIERATVWRALLAILGDISAKRIDPYAKIAIH